MNFVQVFQNLNSPLVTITMPSWLLMLICILAGISLLFTCLNFVLKCLIQYRERQVTKWQRQFMEKFKSDLITSFKARHDSDGPTADTFSSEAERMTQQFMKQMKGQ